MKKKKGVLRKIMKGVLYYGIKSLLSNDWDGSDSGMIIIEV